MITYAPEPPDEGPDSGDPGVSPEAPPSRAGEAAKRAVRSSLMAARRLTGEAGMLPGFLIVGGQRCGTVSMSRALSQHPAMFGSVLHQEVHYFDTRIRSRAGLVTGATSRSGRGRGWPTRTGRAARAGHDHGGLGQSSAPNPP